jgi:hypothetical protein
MQFLASALQKSMEPFSGPTESLRSEIAASSDQGFKKTQEKACRSAVGGKRRRLSIGCRSMQRISDFRILGIGRQWTMRKNENPKKGLKIRLVALVYFCPAKLDAYARRGIKGHLLLTPAAGRSGLRHWSSLKDS